MKKKKNGSYIIETEMSGGRETENRTKKLLYRNTGTTKPVL